jgi:hypothetical protein
MSGVSIPIAFISRRVRFTGKCNAIPLRTGLLHPISSGKFLARWSGGGGGVLCLMSYGFGVLNDQFGMTMTIIVFITYESQWFPAGGVAAVMAHLPKATEIAAHLPTVVVTPFHKNSKKMAALKMEELEVITLSADPDGIPATVFTFSSSCPWYFLQAGLGSPSPFFAGERHPYDLPKNVLLRDSLLFGAAVVKGYRQLPGI